MNKIILLGRLTKKPELREAGKEKTKVSICSIAVDRPTKEKKTDFINLIFWDKKAEIAEKYLDKGSKVLIEGELHIDTYEGTDKKTQYITRVMVNSIEFADSKKEEPAQETIDDLPFN